MQSHRLKKSRVRNLLTTAKKRRLLVVGDVMLDQFIWGNVTRISPEAPVPVVNYTHESFMPGGAANVARNLSALDVQAEMFSMIGRDEAGQKLKKLLKESRVSCLGMLTHAQRATSIKTRIVAHHQQVVRVDRESKEEMDSRSTRRLLRSLEPAVLKSDAVLVGDYAKGLVTQELLDGLKTICRARGIWLSMDPKPIHTINLSDLSLITPNRKETFELAGITDDHPSMDPKKNPSLRRATQRLLETLKPAILLVTLGDQGMLLCQTNRPTIHIPTMAQEVYDVSGAGDTVIGSFTTAIAAGASPLEAAIISNHAAGIVVGKMGTATVTRKELVDSFDA